MGDFDIRTLLAEAKLHKWDDRALAQRSAELAQDLLNASLPMLKSDERTLLSALTRMTTEPKNRLFVEELTARVFRVADPALQAANLKQLITEHGGIPPIFSTMGKLRFKAAAMAAGSMQQTAVAETRRVFHSTFSELTLPTRVEKLTRRVRDLSKEGLTPILSPPVPQVFGSKSAERYRKNLEAILDKQDHVGIIIQPWRLCPDLSPYAPNKGAKALASALKPLIKLSLKSGKARPILLESGLSPTLPLICEALKLALAGADFHRADVALELPAYLRNSTARLRELTEWARARAAKGANPLKVLLVKGSHLAEEQECSFRNGSADPVSLNKAETETRFKQLVHSAITAKPKALIPIIGTHNVFDIAYALLDWGRSGREGLPCFAFTAGLANHIGRRLAKDGATVLLSTVVSPEGSDAGFESYLNQLVAELSRTDGFISAGCAMDSSSLGWGRLRQHFLAALSRRNDNHSAPQKDTGEFRASTLDFLTDRDRTESLLKAAADETERPQEDLTLTIRGQQIDSPLRAVKRSLTVPGMVDYRYTVADFKAVDKVLTIATSATAREPETLDERRRRLLVVARLLRKHEKELVALLVRDAGFCIADADIEINAAIDFCRYYEQSVIQPGLTDGTRSTPLGVVVVAPSRAHPLRDAVSGIAAAWVTGNTLIYKPSPHSVLLARRLTDLLSEAGLGAPALQMLPCLDNQIADKLLCDPRVNALIFHGSTAHSAALTQKAPLRPIFGTTTGQPAVYLAATADKGESIRELCATLFTRRCQSPAAPHLIYIHASVYDDQGFMNALKDAVSGYECLPGHMEGSVLGSLARSPEKEELALLSELDKEGAWLVAPRTEEIGSSVLAPGVRCGICPGGLFSLAVHNVPVLGLIRTESSAQALRLVQESARGMSVAIFTHDSAEQAEWRKQLRGNNLSVNCLPEPHPGSLPFGSALGNKALSGGCDELAFLCHWQEIARPQTRGVQRSMPFAPWETLVPKPDPDSSMRLSMAADSIAYWWEKHFGTVHSLSKSPAQESSLSYRPHPLCIRVDKVTNDHDISIAVMAAIQADCELEISTHTLRAWMPQVERIGARISVESREEYEARFHALASAGVFVRDTAATDENIAEAARLHLNLCRESIVSNGRLELLRCVCPEITTVRHGSVRL